MLSTIEKIEGKYLNALNSKIEHIPLSRDEEYKTFKLYKTSNDIKYRNIIWNANLKFVVSLANKYSGEIPTSDLISEGDLGLLHAIDLFDYESGVRFITYAKYWIRKYISDYLKRFKYSVNMPANKTFEELNIQFVNINESSSLDSNFRNIDVIPNINATQPDTIFNEININKLLNQLSSKEILYLEHYFGLNGKKELTIAEIAELYGEGKSKEWIRQIIERAKKTLKSYISKNISTDVLYL